jgi:outer membrane protein OmpA-like peptidoglycan-associated protein
MLKNTLIVVTTLIVFNLTAQGGDELINVSGKIYSAKDTSAISARLLYEKMPYYDDMGIVTSNEDGTFEVGLLKGNTYNISITKAGYVDFKKEITITSDSVSQTQNEDFYVSVDEIELITLENLIFPSGSATISSSSYAELDELAGWIKANPTIVIQLEGHTDFRGNATANMNLSQARVEAVKEYLEDQKVKKTRILTKAFGGTQPLSRDDTAEAKTRNRRVEVRVIRR